MHEKMRNAATRVGAAVLSVAMGLALVPAVKGTTKVRADGFVKDGTNTKLGVNGIAAPKAPEEGGSAWAGSYVWYGVFEGEPVKFRVLDPHTQDFGPATENGGYTMFLDSEIALKEMKFDNTKIAWADSALREYMNDTFMDLLFWDDERDAIATSVRAGGETYPEGTFYAKEMNPSVGVNDQMFLLDVSEASNPKYGYSNDPGCAPVTTWDDPMWGFYGAANHVKYYEGQKVVWWTRSTNTYSSSTVTCTSTSGDFVYRSSPSAVHGVVPAMNLRNDRILMNTMIKAPDDEGVGGEYILTILADKSEFDIAPQAYANTGIGGDERTMSIPYTLTGEMASEVNRISILILDKPYKENAWEDTDANILFYDGLSGDISTDGAGLFTLPDEFDLKDWGSKYFVYVFAECIPQYENEPEERLTCYATEFYSVDIYDPSCTISFDAAGGTGTMPQVPAWKCMSYTLPECQFTAPEGMAFEAWDLGTPGSTIVINSAITIKPIWKAVPHSITVTSDGGGTGSASPATATIGTEVILTATPNDGYLFKEWQVISGGVTITDNKFVMGGQDVVIKAVFREPTFEDFVERLYTVALGRPSEAEGKAFWVDQVVNKGFTGADCARFFMLGAPEFLGRNLTDDEFVEVLYKTYFDRASEADGKAYWLSRLASGTERAVLVEEFIESVEWCNVCATYGVKSGAKYHKATIASKNAVKFATRLYTCCLGRDPEEDGLNYWSLALTNLDATGYQAASLFFTLPEFVGLQTTNEEYLTRLYKTFMGREPEAEGFAYWLGLLNGGTDRNDVMKAFAGCPEFLEICNQYGIERGEI